jgi:hypothetical protein
MTRRFLFPPLHLGKLATITLVVAALATAVSPPLSAQGQLGLPPHGLRSLGNGQYEATMNVLVEHGDYATTADPACSPEYRPQLRRFLEAVVLAARWKPWLKVVAGPILGDLADRVDQELRQHGGTIAELLAPDRIAKCVPLAMAFPEGSNVEVFLSAGDGDRGASSCENEGPWIPCGVGHAAFVDLTINSNFVVATFKNWSHNRARWASMTVRFTPPPGWRP